jgi:hypothetical protein
MKESVKNQNKHSFNMKQRNFDWFFNLTLVLSKASWIQFFWIIFQSWIRSHSCDWYRNSRLWIQSCIVYLIRLILSIKKWLGNLNSEDDLQILSSSWYSFMKKYSSQIYWKERQTWSKSYFFILCLSVMRILKLNLFQIYLFYFLGFK